MTVNHIIILAVSVILSYPISHYLMTKGMALDLNIPADVKRYKTLGRVFKFPLINVVIMFTYLSYMLHKFKRI